MSGTSCVRAPIKSQENLEPGARRPRNQDNQERTKSSEKITNIVRPYPCQEPGELGSKIREHQENKTRTTKRTTWRTRPSKLL